VYQKNVAVGGTVIYYTAHVFFSIEVEKFDSIVSYWYVDYRLCHGTVSDHTL